MNRRIVVTGIGLVTPIGVGRAEFWNNLLEGRSGIGPVSSFDTSNYRVHRGGEVLGFCADTFITKQAPASLGRASQMAVAAARMAIADAGLPLDSIAADRVGVCMGTTSGEPGLVEQFDDLVVGERVDEIGSELVRLYPCHVIAGHIAREFDLCGVNMVIPAACAAGNYAVAHAFDTLRWGRADVMLAGGADAFSRIPYTGFARLGAIAPERCQPFDLHRQGMIPAEGAAVLVCEPLDDASRRNAHIYAEIAGYGLTCDAHHMTAGHPEGDGAARAMRQALRSSGVRVDEVDYISAHGTGTKTSDRLETIAVKRVFEEQAYNVPISSIKSTLGHTMGAASAIEAAVCAL
ncbi:MAG: beta-ketoacyl-[acyl-carrier-protein] synthase family protein, partial [Betaproteobacteria bacterium]